MERAPLQKYILGLGIIKITPYLTKYIVTDFRLNSKKSSPRRAALCLF